jgi:alpha-methylacyl-CoA racemase
MLEFAGLGPAPFAGMMFSDMGAEVLRIERRGGSKGAEQLIERGRCSITLDLKQPRAVELCLKLCERADAVFEGFRPGVMERLGLGPDVMLARNARLVYGRMTGWGQYGPCASAAGHDINYLALSGALSCIGTEEKPVPPLNLVADYGGGSMFLIAGILAAMMHARATGQGQVVDAAMTDGAAYLTTLYYAMSASGDWVDRRRANLLDGGAPFYDTYRCADGKWVSIGSLEPQFYALLLEKIEAVDALPQAQMERRSWPDMQCVLREIFAKKTRQEWCELLENTDVCFAPVLSLAEAPAHPHNVARQTFVEAGGVFQPAPAPRFSATPSAIQSSPAPSAGPSAAQEALEAWGIDLASIEEP